MTTCSLEQNIDGLTDGNDGDTNVSDYIFFLLCLPVSEMGFLFLFDD